MSSEAGAIMSDDPLDFASFIVYLKRKGNDELRALCADHSELVLQCVEDIESTAGASKPPWLRGVPTVVRLPGYEIITGTQALEAIRKWAATRPKAVGMPQAASVGVSLLGLGSLTAEEGSSSSTGFSSLEEVLRRREQATPSQRQQ